MKIKNHWLSQVTKLASSNFDQRPVATDISLIVIHCISLPPNQFGENYIEQLFCNQLNPDKHPYFKTVYQSKVSAHILIKRNGNIIQFVAFNKRAWHAGVSNYKGRPACNDFSIGIELEGTETREYTAEQYEQLIAVVQILIHYYPNLSIQDIVGHSEVAPERKTDPGDSFDWDRFLSQLCGIPPK